MGRQPVYMNVHNAIKEAIARNEYPVGSLLPPEPDLEKAFQVSRTTIRKAIEILARSGYVEVKQGRGTLILDYSINQNISRITSISQTLRKKGYKVVPKKIHIDTVMSDMSISKALDIKINTEVVRIQRIQLAENVPIAIMENYLNPEIVKSMERLDISFVSLYEFLQEQFNIILDSSIDKITAKVSDFIESEMLQIPIGSALLTMRRLTFSGSTPVTYDYLRIRADKYQFEIDVHNMHKDF